MEPEKEKWINDVLGSLNGLQRAEPNPFLFVKIRNRLQAKPRAKYVSGRVVWLTAVSFILLLFLNWRIINQSSALDPDQTTGLNAVISDLNLYPIIAEPYTLWSEQNY